MWKIYIYNKEVYSFFIEVVIIIWLCSREYMYTDTILYNTVKAYQLMLAWKTHEE